MRQSSNSPTSGAVDYYPFGLTFNSYLRENSVAQNYLYNGKEKQDELDLSWMDYGARMYMPEVGRWGTPDPLADKYVSFSPFAYVANQPVNFVDPDGTRIDDTSNLDKDQTKQYRQVVREFKRSSPVFRKLYRQLKRSDATYTIGAISKGNSNFMGNFSAEGMEKLPKGGSMRWSRFAGQLFC